MGFQDVVVKIFNKENLESLVACFVSFAAGFKDKTNEEKKAYVIDEVIALQQKKFNIKVIPDSIEVYVLEWLLNKMIDEVYGNIKSFLPAAT